MVDLPVPMLSDKKVRGVLNLNAESTNMEAKLDVSSMLGDFTRIFNLDMTIITCDLKRFFAY